jgi:hypothetical protein
MHTRDTAVRVRGVPRCAEIDYRTRTRKTCDLKPTGFRVPVTFPRELVWPDKIAHRSFCKLSLRTSVQQHPGTYSFLLPTSKTDRIFEGNRVIIRSDTTPDPLVPFLTYLKSHDSLFPHRAELWLRENGSIPTRGWFLQRLRSYFPHDTAGQSI